MIGMALSKTRSRKLASPGEIQLKPTGQSLFWEVGHGAYSQTEVQLQTKRSQLTLWDKMTGVQDHISGARVPSQKICVKKGEVIQAAAMSTNQFLHQ